MIGERLVIDDLAPEPSRTEAPPVRSWPAPDIQGTDFDPVLAQLMRDGPLTRIKLPYGEGWAWLVTRYDDVRAVTNDPRFVRAPVTERQITRLAPHFKPRPGSLAFADPPDHHRLRRVVAPAFTARGVDRLRGRSQEILDGLMADLLRHGPPADLTACVLEPFPIAVHCELMGVPDDDRPQLHAWTQEIVFPSRDAEVTARAKDELYGWLAARIRDRRGHDSRRTDILSLLAAGVDRGELTEEEAIGVAGPLQIGGEAVTNNTGQMLFLLLTRPQLLARVRAEPAARPRAVDELLRYVPHRNSVGLARIATEDVELCGTTVRAGEPVYVSYLAANRDPAVFPDPDTIDFDRPAAATHVAFGHGTHYCTGGPLARLQIDLLMDTVLDRLPGLHLAVPPGQVPWRRNALIRGPQGLPVNW